MKNPNFLKFGIALLIAGITMSFQMTNKDVAAEDVVYHYIGTSALTDEFNDLSMWSTTNDSNPCVTEEAELPCKITLPENISLGSVLGTKDNNQVLAISEGRKQEP